MGLFYCFNVRLYVFLQAKNWLLKAAVESAYLSAILTHKKRLKAGKGQKGRFRYNHSSRTEILGKAQFLLLVKIKAQVIFNL